VLPYHRSMRFEGGTPTSKLLSAFMPWMKGRRPAWLIRLGLFLYDNLGGRKILPGTRTLDLERDPAGQPLKAKFAKAYEYSDCWIEDSRLVVLNARDAQARGARALPRAKVRRAGRRDERGPIALRRGGATWQTQARLLVNAGGPWVEDVIRGVVQMNAAEGVRLVRGSHIVTRRLFEHDKCYFFQGTDGRIIFAIPYETDFTLIGTTDQDHGDPAEKPVCTPEEMDYLLRFASEYFDAPLSRDDVVWTYSGVRPLYDDGATSATAATRDYVLTVDETGGAPLLNVFGGKITTYRKLAEAAMAKIAPRLANDVGPWTAGRPLPGGDFPVDGAPALAAQLRADYPFLTDRWAARLVRAYGTEATALLGDAASADDLGEAFGATITAAELDWVIAKEWVQSAEDYLWRRTKLGLLLDGAAVARIDAYIAAQVAAPEPADA